MTRCYFVRLFSNVLMIGSIAATAETGCMQSPQLDRPFARPRRQTCSPPTSNDFYFPVGTFSTSEDDGAGRRFEYSTLLRMMREPSLSCGSEPSEGYRLLLTRPLRDDSYAVTIRRLGRTYTLTANELDRPDNISAIKVVNHVEKTLTEEQWQAATSAIAQARFWFMPTWAIRGSAVFDASTWLLEGRFDSSHHVIVRVTGEEKGPAIDVGVILFRLAGLEIPTDL